MQNWHNTCNINSETNYESYHRQSQLYCGLVSTITIAIYGNRNNIMSIYERLHTDGENIRLGSTQRDKLKWMSVNKPEEVVFVSLKMRLPALQVDAKLQLT